MAAALVSIQGHPLGSGKDVVASAGVTFAALFPIVNPVGMVSVFLALTSGMSPGDRNVQARKTAVAVAGILAVFLVAGRFLLGVFGVSVAALTVVGGLIVGYHAWKMVIEGPAEPTPDLDGGAIYFTPLATPLLAGPGALGVILGLGSRADAWLDYAGFLIGIALLAIVTYLAFASATRITRTLGRKGIDVLSRTFGIFVLAIGVHLILTGIATHFGIATVD